jgi:hypothetical protein
VKNICLYRWKKFINIGYWPFWYRLIVITDIVYFTRFAVTDICRYRLVNIGVNYRLVWLTDIVKLISYRWYRFCMLVSVITDICWYRLMNIGHHYRLSLVTDFWCMMFISVIIPIISYGGNIAYVLHLFLTAFSILAVSNIYAIYYA